MHHVNTVTHVLSGKETSQQRRMMKQVWEAVGKGTARRT